MPIPRRSASPALLKHAPMVLMGLDPAIRIRPRFDIGQLAWLLRFLRNTTGECFRNNTLEGLRLGLESRLAMQRLQDRHSLDFSHVVTGKLHIHDNDQSFNAARAMIALKRRHGAIQEVLSADEARAIEPTLAARTDAMVGAVWSPQEEVGDPHRFCAAMMALLVRDYSVTMRLGTTVQTVGSDALSAHVITTRGELIAADDIVLCAGIGSRKFASQLGLASALQPMKGYSFNAPPGTVAPRVSITDVSRKIVFCPLGDTIRIAGLAELGAYDTKVDPAALARLKSASQESLPEAADYGQASTGWAGIRPMSANSLPQIRRVAPRIAVNIGHGMLGWTFSMGSGERLAAVILGEEA